MKILRSIMEWFAKIGRSILRLCGKLKSKPVVNVVRMQSMTGIAWAVQLLGASLCSFMMYSFVGVWTRMAGAPLWFVSLITFCPAIIIWMRVLCKTPMLSWWFVKVKPLHVIVVGKMLMRDCIPAKITCPADMYAPGSLREIGQGWHGKFPWEVMVGKPISLESEILIGHSMEDGDPLVTYTSDQVPIHFDYVAPLTALRGYIVNHIKYDDMAQITFFRALFDEFLIGWSKAHTAEEVYKELTPDGMKQLKEAFRLLLGGKGSVHDIEMERGRFTGDPKLNRVELEPAMRDALQTEKISEQISKGVEILIKPFKGTAVEKDVDPNVMTMVAANVAGKMKDFEPIVLVGLKGADPKAVAAAQAAFGKGSKPGKNKNK